MSIEALSAVLHGVRGEPVRLETGILSQLPTFTVVGLPQNSVREARERVRSAIEATGLPFPRRRITVNLAPADLPKSGTGLDLPMALGVVGAAEHAATGRAPWDAPPFAIGELGLDGAVHPVRGALPLVEAGRRAGARHVIVARANAVEASLVPDVQVLAVDSLSEAWQAATGSPWPAFAPPPRATRPPRRRLDLAEVRGLNGPRRALEVAAAGGHDLLLEGPPGSGKSMLARRLSSVLPDLLPEEALEVVRIHSAAGLLGQLDRLELRPPLRAPHHSASMAALVGGGRPLRPGEVTLAHRGVLLLDEAPEFQRNALEALRQPLEDGLVTVSRAAEVLTMPARFQLVLTRNPCPCGLLGSGSHACTCLLSERERYRARLSGPVLDRLDMVSWVDPVEPGRLLESPTGDDSATVQRRVSAARAAQRERAPDRHSVSNADAPAERLLPGFDRRARRALDVAISRSRGSSRAVLQLVRVARSVADLDGSDTVTRAHVTEALLLCAGSPTNAAGAARAPSLPRRPHLP